MCEVGIGNRVFNPLFPSGDSCLSQDFPRGQERSDTLTQSGSGSTSLGQTGNTISGLYSLTEWDGSQTTVQEAGSRSAGSSFSLGEFSSGSTTLYSSINDVRGDFSLLELDTAGDSL